MPENEKKQYFGTLAVHGGQTRREDDEGTRGADLPDDQLCV